MAVLGSRRKAAATPGWRTCLGVDVAEGWQSTWTATRARGGASFSRASAPTARDRTPISTALPVHSTFLRRLRAPFASVAKAEKVWPSLLDIQLPFPLENAVYQFLAPERTADGQVETLAVAVRREDLEAWRSRLQAGGFIPWRLDHEGLALWSRSVTEQPLEKQGHRMVCYVGVDRVALVWGQGEKLIAASGLRLGARDLFDPERGEAARRQWAQRAGQFLRAQSGGALPNYQWAWCGPGAARPDQVSQLAAVLESSPDATLFTHREPDAFLARAVGARAVRPEADDCSLLPDDLAPPALQKARQARAFRAPLALAASALLLLGVNLGWSTWVGRQRDQLQTALRNLATDLSGNPALPRGQEVLLTERALKEQAPSYQPFRQALAPSLTLVLQDVLNQAATLGMRLEKVSLGEKALLCSGSITDWAHGETLANTLGSAGWVTELERGEAGEDERIPFTLKASR